MVNKPIITMSNSKYCPEYKLQLFRFSSYKNFNEMPDNIKRHIFRLLITKCEWEDLPLLFRAKINSSLAEFWLTDVIKKVLNRNNNIDYCEQCYQYHSTTIHKCC